MFLGRKITKRCGNEGQHKDLEEKQAAISYISEATNMGADLSNAEFTFFTIRKRVFHLGWNWQLGVLFCRRSK